MNAKGLTLLSMTLGFVVVQVDVTVVNVATQTIGASIGGSVSALQWVVNAYTLAFASLILTAGASIAISIGPIIGGVLISAWGWRSIFLINLPIGALGIWLSLRYAKESPRDENRSPDLPGQITAVAALTVLAAALIEGGKQGWSNAFGPAPNDTITA